jgi:hypothetical protein
MQGNLKKTYSRSDVLFDNTASYTAFKVKKWHSYNIHNAALQEKLVSYIDGKNTQNI